jgi:hypothetical protein
MRGCERASEVMTWRGCVGRGEDGVAWVELAGLCFVVCCFDPLGVAEMGGRGVVAKEGRSVAQTFDGFRFGLE